MNSDDYMIFCTLFDSNYLDKGLAAYYSMRKHIDDFKLYIFAFDDRCYQVLEDMHLKNVILVSLEEIMNERIRKIKVERTRAEFCWTCTPIVIEHVLNKYQEKVCTYIDADIYFFANPNGAIQEILNHGCSVGLTPHRFERNYRNVQEIFYNGKYCIQFNTFFSNEEGLSVLKRWKEDCLNWCYYRYEDGKLGDQKYADSWVMKYFCVHESEDLGSGVAPWNLHLYSYEGRRNGEIWLRYMDKPFLLIFYHFEGLKYLNNGKIFLNLWKYSNLGTNRKVKLIYGEYFNELKQIRKYLKNYYGVSFEHMQIDKGIFLKKNYSLVQFCRDRGVFGGLREWMIFRVNNLMIDS